MIEGLLHGLAVVARSFKSNAHMHASASPAGPRPHPILRLKKTFLGWGHCGPFLCDCCTTNWSNNGGRGVVGGGARCPKDTIWHVGPFGTQSAILAKMGTLQILSIKPPQVPCCHMWQVGFLMLMWDSALGQSKITGIFFRQGLRVRQT